MKRRAPFKELSGTDDRDIGRRAGRNCSMLLTAAVTGNVDDLLRRHVGTDRLLVSLYHVVATGSFNAVRCTTKGRRSRLAFRAISSPSSACCSLGGASIRAERYVVHGLATRTS